MAHEGNLHSADNVLTLPITASCALEAIEHNVDTLKEQMKDEKIEFCRSALKSMHERHEKSKEDQSKIPKKYIDSALNLLSMSSKTKKDKLEHNASADSHLVAFGDENHENELVYAVGIDRFHKRVTVCFRGSVTRTDFITDATIDMQATPNPLAGFPEQQGHVKIHRGFYVYLLGRPKVDSKRAVNRTYEMNKFEEILQHVIPLLNDNPGYKLYVTGHSLGGALATLFSFEVATYSEATIPLPITCISVASPKVGDESFRKAFQLLEEQGRVRHLRIVNENDPVTLIPSSSVRKTLATISPAALAVSLMKKSEHYQETYKHVGIKLKLFPVGKTPKFKISYARGKWNQNVLSPLSVTSISNHYGDEYSSRMLAVQNDLEKLYINDIYTTKHEKVLG